MTPPIIFLKMSVNEEKAFEVSVLSGHWRLRKVKDVFAQFLFEVVLVWCSVLSG